MAEADYHEPTVCTEFDVTQLADHLIGSVTYLGAAAGAAADPVSGPHEMPAGAALGILSIEFLVHAWDFARGGGSFADPTEAGPDAGLLDRLVAFTGRAL